MGDLAAMWLTGLGEGTFLEAGDEFQGGGIRRERMGPTLRDGNGKKQWTKSGQTVKIRDLSTDLVTTWMWEGRAKKANLPSSANTRYLWQAHLLSPSPLVIQLYFHLSVHYLSPNRPAFSPRRQTSLIPRVHRLGHSSFDGGRS